MYSQNEVPSHVWNAIGFQAGEMRDISLVQEVVPVQIHVKSGFAYCCLNVEKL